MLVKPLNSDLFQVSVLYTILVVFTLRLRGNSRRLNVSKGSSQLLAQKKRYTE